MKKITINIVLATLCIFFKAELSAAVIVSGLVPKHNNKLLPDTNKYKIRPLKIGDAIPETIWNMPLQVVNHPKGKQTITLNDYKGKLIILDFWATWCGACVSAMPKSNALEKEFKEHLTIIPVTFETAEIAGSFLAQNRRVKDLNLWSLVNDNILKTIFPHRFIPHYVWISQRGTYIAETSDSELNSVSIQSIINNDKYKLKNKIDLDGELPLFLSNHISIDDDSHYSVLFKGKYPGLPSGSRFRKSGEILRGRAATNSELLFIYECAIRALFSNAGLIYNRKMLILDIKDTTQVENKLFSGGKKGNEIVYNFDLIVPVKTAGLLYDYMLADLNRYTNFYGRIEKRATKCLIAINGSHKTRTNNQEKGTRSIPEKYFFADINSLRATPLPIINESTYHGPFNIALKETDDLNQIKKHLFSYGLELIEAVRMIDKFVLSDKSNINAETNLSY